MTQCRTSVTVLAMAEGAIARKSGCTNGYCAQSSRASNAAPICPSAIASRIRAAGSATCIDSSQPYAGDFGSVATQ
jgi:hypothetical protein